jgi:hypothetical protein
VPDSSRTSTRATSTRTGAGDVCDSPSVLNADQANTDGDAFGRVRQLRVVTPSPDRDRLGRDGIGNPCDNCPTVSNPSQSNGDGDGLGDDCDACPDDSQNDQDADGICAGSGHHPPQTGDGDNCPTVANPDQADADSDGTGDVCDPCPLDPLNDSDYDGICVGDAFNPPKVGKNDNCPTVRNTNQSNLDQDPLGDACDSCPDDAQNDQEVTGSRDRFGPQDGRSRQLPGDLNTSQTDGQ